MNPALYVVLHLPKTAGSTLAANFGSNFEGDRWLHVSPRIKDWRSDEVLHAVETEIAIKNRARTRCIFGHWAYWGIHRHIRSDCTPHYITFLREPVERCLSLYGYIKTRPEALWHRAVVKGNYSLSEWIEQEDAFEFFDGQLRRLLFSDSNDVLLETLTRDHLEIAKQRLQEYWFVGLTEAFAQDSLFLYGKLNFLRFHPDQVINATPNKYLSSPEEKHALAQVNRLDTELYQFARQLHFQWLRENAEEIRLQRRKARILKALHSRCSMLKRSLPRFSAQTSSVG